MSQIRLYSSTRVGLQEYRVRQIYFQGAPQTKIVLLLASVGGLWE